MAKAKVHPDQFVFPVDLSVPETPARAESSDKEWKAGPEVYKLDPRLWDCLFLWDLPGGRIAWARNKSDAIGMMARLGLRFLPGEVRRRDRAKPKPASAFRWSGSGPNRRPEQFSPRWIAYAKRRKKALK